MANVYDVSGGLGSSGRRMSAQEQLAQALLQQGLSGDPVYNPLQGLGRIGKALAGAYIGRTEREARAEEENKAAKTLGEAAALVAGGRPGGLQSTGGMGGDQVADVPAIAPGMAGLQEALRIHSGSPGIARSLPTLLQVAQASEKQAPKAPEGFRFNAQGGLEVIPGYAEGKGAMARATRKTPEELRAEAEAGWKSPERLQQEAEIAARTQAKYREPAQEPLVEVADPNSPTGTRYVPRSQAIGQPGKPPSGMRVTTNPDGTVSIEQGRQGMGSKTVSDLEEKIRNATDGLARVDQIGKSFKPEYQQLGTRWSAMATAVKEKVGFEPDPESKTALADFSRFKREALNNLNLYIKEITGAAMSNAEAERITRALPNPGVGLMDGDSPTEFQAKMESVQRELRAAVGRANYALKNGLNPMSIPLDQVPMLMRERAQQIQGEVDITQPGMAPEAKAAEVKRRLAVEFGLK